MKRKNLLKRDPDFKFSNLLMCVCVVRRILNTHLVLKCLKAFRLSLIHI